MIEHTPLQVAFIGLGTMGFPMAGHLSERGHRVVVYNRNPEKAVDWRNLHNGDVAATPRRGRRQRGHCDDVRW